MLEAGAEDAEDAAGLPSLLPARPPCSLPLSPLSPSLPSLPSLLTHFSSSRLPTHPSWSHLPVSRCTVRAGSLCPLAPLILVSDLQVGQSPVTEIHVSG